ncbi:S-adenosyl-L-methionine-dependent methyltransferase [Lindgomyces ingoldianus]|uniref:S-adenosyl-L-methionine-dependent methyltransferase n=1 Tax=Lindgomyces ingoldianus TaxID=673940 RepID=A0ACB6QW99_9PLEO|nr:S-adenosyl-L-methionine-dependent methyltransferase [Lindgomyces ingoldianus]KAF2471150.1 S-adenosyl-L-methionine-dependent methyltransferase [Lindgomyces ingoldianus]
MPRLSTALLRHAYTIDPLLPLLLRPCRNLLAAQNELRWLREYVDMVARSRRMGHRKADRKSLLRQLARERASGKPLQYILGTEYFGDLEIRCRPGVLIPRQETAASITYLVRLIRNAQSLPPELRVLDLCTGTGCIPLLFHHEFCSARKDVALRVLGVDISEKATELAEDNLRQVQRRGDCLDQGEMGFMLADVLIDPFGDQTLKPPSVKAAFNFNRKPVFWDVLTSNPPYISPSAYWKTTTRSVRGFEPKLALVPPPAPGNCGIEQGDLFYPRILHIARDVEAKIVLLEVADMNQALRVAKMARELNIFDGVEIWRDQPDQIDDSSSAELQGFPVIGQGNGRSVLCWRGIGATWLGKGASRNNLNLIDDHRLFRSYWRSPFG